MRKKNVAGNVDLCKYPGYTLSHGKIVTKPIPHTLFLEKKANKTFSIPYNKHSVVHSTQ